MKGKLRQASLRWPPRSEALKRARKDRGKYQCAMCLELHASSQVHLDHIQPVVDVKDGWVNWDHFINRLFCDAEGFQVLCSICHDAKTKIEDSMRTHFSTKRREIKKKQK